SGSEPPLPFAGQTGWTFVAAVGLPFPEHRYGLLGVGRDGDGAFPEETRARLGGVAIVAALALDRDSLVEEARDALGMTSAAVEGMARSAGAQSPDEIRQIVLEGLVKDMGMEASGLWEPHPSGRGMVLTRSFGLPQQVQR